MSINESDKPRLQEFLVTTQILVVNNSSFFQKSILNILKCSTFIISPSEIHHVFFFTTIYHASFCSERLFCSFLLVLLFCCILICSVFELFHKLDDVYKKLDGSA